MDDSTLHALVQRTGARAEEQAQRRYEKLPEERLPQRGPSKLGVLMVDGCLMRYRGPGGGQEENQARPRRMARIEAGGILSTRGLHGTQQRAYA